MQRKERKQQIQNLLNQIESQQAELEYLNRRHDQTIGREYDKTVEQYAQAEARLTQLYQELATVRATW